MKRLIGNILAILSLLLAMVSAYFWFRTYSHWEYLYHTTRHEPANWDSAEAWCDCTSYGALSDDGRIQLERFQYVDRSGLFPNPGGECGGGKEQQRPPSGLRTAC